VQVLSAHHVHSDNDYFSQTSTSFECFFKAFGDSTKLIGDVVEAEGGDGGEIKFTSNETKFLFKASISALESMFDNMDPVVMKFKPQQDKLDDDIPRFVRAMTLAPGRKRSIVRSPDNTDFSQLEMIDKQKSSGKIEFKNLAKDR
jgi:hypothetical protein